MEQVLYDSGALIAIGRSHNSARSKITWCGSTGEITSLCRRPWRHR